jgi:Na+/melibiose symporter-like transporter
MPADVATPARTPPPFTPATRFAYGLGSVAFGVKGQLMSTLLLLYFNQLVGLPAEWVSLAIGVSLVFDAVWDPLVGQVSDNWRSRWGRRHPFMYAAAIPSGVTLYMLFNPPRDWSQPALFVYMLVMIVAARSALSLYEVPATALTPELATQYDERTKLFSLRYFFGSGSAGAISLIGYGVFLVATPEQPMGQLNREAYPPYAATTGAIMFVSIMIASLVTHKYIPYLYKPPARRESMLGVLRQMAQALGTRNFLILSLSALFMGARTGLGSGLDVYFSTFFWELPSRKLLVIVLGSIGASFLALFVAPGVAARFGKKHGCMLLMGLGVLASTLPLPLGLMGLMPAKGGDLLVAILFVDRLVANCCGVAAAILIASMLSDLVEENQVKTGRRAEGLITSADNVLQKIAQGLASILPGVMLMLVAFPPKARPGAVEPEIVRNLILLYIPAALIFGLLAVAAIGFYRIDRARHEANLATLRKNDAFAGLEPEPGSSST